MNTKRKHQTEERFYWIILTISCFTLLLVLVLLVPIWVALTAGLASVSIVVFGILFVLLAISLQSASVRRSPTIWLGIVGALLGLLLPQATYIAAAHQTGAALAFNPRRYVAFSGKTDLRPSSTLTYKDVAHQPLQIAFYRTHQSGSRPVVVLLHGGAWRYGDHLEVGQWPAYLTAAGYHVASVQYRLSSDTYHSWRDAPRDVHDAITYLQTHADELSIDQTKIHLLGQSAGGHLALLEAYRSSGITTVTALYAPIDLQLDYTTSRDKSAEVDFIGGTPSQYPDRYSSVSPLNFVSNDSPPTLLIQGLSDDLVHPENARQLSQALAHHSVEHKAIFLPYTGHSFENQRGGFATQISSQQILKFLNR